MWGPWLPHVDNSGLHVMKAVGSEESVLFISVSRTSQVTGFRPCVPGLELRRTELASGV